MGLEVRISGPGGTLDDVPASDATLFRRLGAPVAWEHLVRLDDVRQRDQMVDILAGGDATIKGQARLGANVVPLGPESQVVDARWLEEHGFVLHLRSLLTKTDAQASPHALQPRWRVHKVKNFKDLVKRFDQTLQIADRGVENALLQVTFPDARNASILQCGLSDWEFVHLLVHQYQRLCKDNDLKPLCISGSVTEEHAGQWVLTWGAKQPFETCGQVSERTMEFGDDDGFERAHFDVAPSCRHPRFPLLHHAGAGRIRQGRPFDSDRWKSWSTQDVPLFTQQSHKMAWMVIDRLFDTHDRERVDWSTTWYVLPDSATVPSPGAFPNRHGLVVRGKVDDSDGQGPWIDIRLDGFETDDDNDLAHVRLCTPYSGLDEKTGVHFMAEKDSRCFVVWSGLFDESVMYGGNSRWDAAKLESPSVYLEKLERKQLADVEVEQIGKTTIKSDYEVEVDQDHTLTVMQTFATKVMQDTTLDSMQPYTVNANGARFTMNGGIFKTGMGM